MNKFLIFMLGMVGATSATAQEVPMPPTIAVPEPSTFLLIGAGVAGIVLVRALSK